MSFPSDFYTLRASPVVGPASDGLYATGNGVNEPVTVVPNSSKLVEYQTVSALHLHVFWIIETPNALLPILFSGTFKPSMARKAYTLSLSRPMGVPLEGVGSRGTNYLFLRSPSLLRKRFTNGTLPI